MGEDHSEGGLAAEDFSEVGVGPHVWDEQAGHGVAVLLVLKLAFLLNASQYEVLLSDISLPDFFPKLF
ncbi:unnamed protein product [Sphagnum balticum]